MAVIDRIRDLVEPVVTADRLSLYDVEHNGGQVRITVEGPDGVSLDRLADLNRQISRLLDDADPISGTYTLEVSSPGLERPLRRPEHFAAAVGELVSVKTGPEVDGPRRTTGVLVEADDDGVTVRPADGDDDDTDEADGDGRRLRYDQIVKARTIFEWGPDQRERGDA